MILKAGIYEGIAEVGNQVIRTSLRYFEKIKSSIMLSRLNPKQITNMARSKIIDKT